MINTSYFKIQNSFVDDLYNLSGSTIKVNIVLRSLVRENESTQGGVWVRCSYDYLREKTGLKSNTSVRKAILQLITYGWIQDFKRGFFQEEGENRTNAYKLPNKRIKSPDPLLYLKAVSKKDVK